MSSRYDDLVRALQAEIPGFRVIRKDRSRFQRAIDKALKIVTFGQLRDYMTCYQTTIGRTMYVTSDWDERDPDRRYVTLRHEAVHLRQFRRFTVPLMAILYIFVFLPFGLAYFRARFEMEAYAETLRATYEVFGAEEANDPCLRQSILEQFTSASYGWMWPFKKSMNRWYDRVIAEVESKRSPA